MSFPKTKLIQRNHFFQAVFVETTSQYAVVEKVEGLITHKNMNCEKFFSKRTKEAYSFY
jgi:hypothetical protein